MFGFPYSHCQLVSGCSELYILHGSLLGFSPGSIFHRVPELQTFRGPKPVPWHRHHFEAGLDLRNPRPLDIDPFKKVMYRGSVSGSLLQKQGQITPWKIFQRCHIKL